MQEIDRSVSECKKENAEHSNLTRMNNNETTRWGTRGTHLERRVEGFLHPPFIGWCVLVFFHLEALERHEPTNAELAPMSIARNGPNRS